MAARPPDVALPPIADIRTSHCHVRFVPKADAPRSLFDPYQRAIDFCRSLSMRKGRRGSVTSAAVPKVICDRIMIAFAVTVLFVLHMYAADLNGAWANDPNVCSQIFVKKNEKISMADHSDMYGRGFIIEGNEVTDQLATCHIKDRKVDDSMIRLAADCSTDMGRFTDQLILRIDGNDRLTRFFVGMRGMGLTYFRCPAIK